MPGFDGTGPFGNSGWNCRRGRNGPGSGRGFGRRACLRNSSAQYLDELNLPKEDQKRILEAELKQVEMEKKQIEEKLKELD